MMTNKDDCDVNHWLYVGESSLLSSVLSCLR